MRTSLTVCSTTSEASTSADRGCEEIRILTIKCPRSAYIDGLAHTGTRRMTVIVSLEAWHVPRAGRKPASRLAQHEGQPNPAARRSEESYAD